MRRMGMHFTKLGATFVVALMATGCSLEVDFAIDREDGGPFTFDASVRAELPGGSDEASEPEPGERAGALLPALPPAPPNLPEPEVAEQSKVPIPPAPPLFQMPTVVDGAVRDALWRRDLMVGNRHVELPELETIDRSRGDGPHFTPFTEAPRIANRLVVSRATASLYPREFRSEELVETVRVYFYINAMGQVEDILLDQRSRHEAFNRAAVRVAETYEFYPAKNRGVAVPVWVSFPITFQR